MIRICNYCENVSVKETDACSKCKLSTCMVMLDISLFDYVSQKVPLNIAKNVVTKLVDNKNMNSVAKLHTM